MPLWAKLFPLVPLGLAGGAWAMNFPVAALFGVIATLGFPVALLARSHLFKLISSVMVWGGFAGFFLGVLYPPAFMAFEQPVVSVLPFLDCREFTDSAGPTCSDFVIDNGGARRGKAVYPPIGQ